MICVIWVVVEGGVAGADWRLVRLAARGDDGAATALWQRYRPLITSVAQRYRHAGVDADDLVSEVWVAFLAEGRKLLRELSPNGPFASLMTRIAFRTATRLARSAGREIAVARLSAEGEFEFDIMLPAAPSTELDLLRADDAMAVRRAFGGLAATDRRVLSMRCLMGLSYAEIAKLAGTHEGAARKRAFDALRRLERSLRSAAPECIENLSVLHQS